MRKQNERSLFLCRIIMYTRSVVNMIKLYIFCCSEYSMQLNASRIKFLQAQDDVVNAMKESASKDLLNVSRDHHVYKKLLKDLIVQVSI